MSPGEFGKKKKCETVLLRLAFVVGRARFLLPDSPRCPRALRFPFAALSLEDGGAWDSRVFFARFGFEARKASVECRSGFPRARRNNGRSTADEKINNENAGTAPEPVSPVASKAPEPVSPLAAAPEPVSPAVKAEDDKGTPSILTSLAAAAVAEQDSQREQQNLLAALEAVMSSTEGGAEAAAPSEGDKAVDDAVAAMRQSFKQVAASSDEAAQAAAAAEAAAAAAEEAAADAADEADAEANEDEDEEAAVDGSAAPSPSGVPDILSSKVVKPADGDEAAPAVAEGEKKEAKSTSAEETKGSSLYESANPDGAEPAKAKLSGGAIAGIVVGSAVGAALLAGVAAWAVKSRAAGGGASVV